MWKVFESGDNFIFESKIFFPTNDFTKKKIIVFSTKKFPYIFFKRRKIISLNLSDRRFLLAVKKAR